MGCVGGEERHCKRARSVRSLLEAELDTRLGSEIRD